jgi:acetylornithine/N-succinyldiaminopimelate aminotransferase
METNMQPDTTQQLTEQHILKTYGRLPLTLTTGNGAYVKDSNGKEYLDFLTGIACTPLGHQHPRIIDAIINQAKKILHTSNLYHHASSANLAAYLTQHGGLDKVFFCNSGTEANEAAIKLARKYHWRNNNKNKTQILSAERSFHGRTFASLSATAKPAFHEGFQPLAQQFHYADPTNTEVFCAKINDNTAAVLLEPIQGEGGVYPLEKSFLQAVRKKCDETGALLIFDEVQCGIGRTGELFAWQYYDVKPDIITLAKGLGNGLPIGAVCVTDKASIGLQPGDHGTTFGGNPVSCEAALTVLKTIVEDNLLDKVKENSALLFGKLTELQQKYPAKIKQVRGVGLMIGIQVTTDDALKILNYCQDKGLLVNVASGNVIRLLPPYIINKQDIDKAVGILEEAIM